MGVPDFSTVEDVVYEWAELTVSGMKFGDFHLEKFNRRQVVEQFMSGELRLPIIKRSSGLILFASSFDFLDGRGALSNFPGMPFLSRKYFVYQFAVLALLEYFSAHVHRGENHLNQNRSRKVRLDLPHPACTFVCNTSGSKLR